MNSRNNIPSTGSSIKTGFIRRASDTRRNGNDFDHTSTVGKQPDPTEPANEDERSLEDSLNPIPMSLVTRAGSMDHFATVPRLTTTLKKTMTVRALFEYDPLADTGLPSRGLPFQHGDILHVVNASDREWWQARKMTLVAGPGATGSNLDSGTTSLSSVAGQSPLGIIPSSERIERRHRIRSKRVNFFTKVTVIGSNAPPQAPQTTGNTSVSNPAALPPHPSMGHSSPPGQSSPLSSASPSPLNGDHAYRFPATQAPSNYSSLDRGVVPGSEGDKKHRSNSLTLNLFKRFSGRGRRKENSLSLGGGLHANPMDAVFEADMNAIRSYEIVMPITINLTRPVLIFGPLKERVIDMLLQDPKFTTCVPHTSRPPRTGERDGIDYHFVQSKAAMEEEIRADRFIEVGQFQDHYYATSVSSVRQVLQSGRVCVLDVSLSAIKRLELEGLYPISVLLKPLSVLHLRAVQRRLTEDQAKRSIDLALRLEADNWRVFSTIIVYDTIEGAASAIQRFVQLNGGPVIWIPSNSPLPRFSKGLASMGSQSSTLPRAPPPLVPSGLR